MKKFLALMLTVLMLLSVCSAMAVAESTLPTFDQIVLGENTDLTAKIHFVYHRTEIRTVACLAADNGHIVLALVLSFVGSIPDDGHDAMRLGGGDRVAVPGGDGLEVRVEIKTGGSD